MQEGKFRDTYRIASARLPGWDYTSAGYYFITICVQDKREIFGKIENGIMCLFQTGAIAYNYWLEILRHFNHVYIDAFVVMPDHVHGIIHIDHGNALRCDTCMECKRWYGERRERFKNNVGGNMGECHKNNEHAVETGHCPVSTIAMPSNIINTPNTVILPQPGSVSSIVGSYKSIVSKSINKLFHQHNIQQSFSWQKRFYDGIIRHETALRNIRNYIYNNPVKWYRDQNSTF